MLALVITPLMSIAQQPYENWDTDSEEHIYKEIITHKIINQELIDFIVKYDVMYAQSIADSTLGITIFCRVSKKTIAYSVSYSVNIGSELPVLLCEPINGRDVYLYLFDLHKQIILPRPRSVQLLKNSNAEQYEDYKRGQNELKKQGVDGISMITVTNSFPWWEIVFDKHTGKCLSKSTSNKTEIDKGK